jgi:acyl-CoA dehydrogenase
LPDARSAFRDLVATAADAAADTRRLWRALGRSGVLDPFVEVDPVRLDELLTELDARLPLGTVLSVCVQVATVIPLLHTAAGTGPWAEKVLAELRHGDAVVALAATDSAVAGSALLDARTEVQQDGGDVILDGGKSWITNADHCDYALVLARHRPARHFTSFCWVLVPSDHSGVSREPAARALFAGSGVGHLRFDGVRLGREHIVGRPGRALADFAHHVGTERLAGALWARALCRRVLRDTHGYLAGRSTGDGTLWSNAAVRDRFARCVVEWRRLDALCTAFRPPFPTGEGMVLKAACGEAVDRILAECVSLRGADAFRDGGVAHLREQAAMFGIAGGATGTMLAGVADHADELLGGTG